MGERYLRVGSPLRVYKLKTFRRFLDVLCPVGCGVLLVRHAFLDFKPSAELGMVVNSAAVLALEK